MGSVDGQWLWSGEALRMEAFCHQRERKFFCGETRTVYDMSEGSPAAPSVNDGIPVVDVSLLRQIKVEQQEIAVAVEVCRQREVVFAESVEADGRQNDRLGRACSHRNDESEQKNPGCQGTHVSDVLFE